MHEYNEQVIIPHPLVVNSVDSLAFHFKNNLTLKKGQIQINIPYNRIVVLNGFL